jgi:aryl-alcohol dehydrogenase-like predicted oxidoreductase
MKYANLGQNGPEISRLALGCMSFAGVYGTTDRDESFACLDAARDAGITLLDTAEIYGISLSETIIGEWQRDRGHRFNIATKGGIVVGGKRGDVDNTPEGLRRALEGSLTRLGVDAVELYYIHRRQFDIPVENVVETLVGFQQEGLIGGFGLSEVAPSTLRRAHAVAPVSAVQNEYSLWTRYPELGMVQACAELGVTFVPFSPLARGMFGEVAKDRSHYEPLPFCTANPRFMEPNITANNALIQGFREYVQSRGWTVSGAALAWLLDKGDNIVPIPGTRSAAHLNEWAGACEIEFTDADRVQINKLLPPGFAHGDRYSDEQIVGIERYC